MPTPPVQDDIYEDTVESPNPAPPLGELEEYEPFEPVQESQDPEPAPAPVPPGVPIRPPKRKKSPRSSDAEQTVERKWYFEIFQWLFGSGLIFFYMELWARGNEHPYQNLYFQLDRWTAYFRTDSRCVDLWSKNSRHMVT